MKLGYLYSRYPVISQTFCDAEMLELERRGWDLVIASMYPPKTSVRHEYLARFRAQVQYAPDKHALEELVKKAKRSGRWPDAMVKEHSRKYGPDYKAALRARNALFFVQLFECERVPHFHVHFANRAAHTALFVTAISGIPFSLTAHGQDFMSDLGNDDLLREICAAAQFVGAETEYSRDLLVARSPESTDKIVRVFNGLELAKFRLPETTTGKIVRVLSVGRLVPFKGFDLLVDACAEVTRRGVAFQCEIIGGGELRDELQGRAAERGLTNVCFAGERSHNQVLEALANCDVFVLASRIDERGASDIFPTVIAEAMACGKPVVSTTVAGIPELVVQNETGLLVPPNDSRALADALVRLIEDDELRERFGRAGRKRIEEHFTIERTIEPLIARLTANQISEITNQK
jgi:glycosyltransferase involved in cell wall biosynthesis